MAYGLVRFKRRTRRYLAGRVRPAIRYAPYRTRKYIWRKRRPIARAAATAALMYAGGAYARPFVQRALMGRIGAAKAYRAAIMMRGRQQYAAAMMPKLLNRPVAGRWAYRSLRPAAYQTIMRYNRMAMRLPYKYNLG